MSKITDYSEILAEVTTQLAGQEWSITDCMTQENAAFVVANIYLMNDLCAGFGQDIDNSASVISSRKRISVIYDGRCGMFRHHENLCLYESLSDDISVILMVLQAAFDRMTD